MRLSVFCPSEYFGKWTGLFSALRRRSDVHLQLFVDDAHRLTASPDAFVVRTSATTRALRFPALRYWKLNEHAESLKAADAAFVIADASYVLVSQVLKIHRQVADGARVACRAAQLVRRDFPWPIRSWERFALSNVKFVASLNELSDSVARAKYPMVRILRVPNGYDPHVFHLQSEQVRQSTTNEINIIYVGEIGFHKGVHTLLHAVKSMSCRVNLRIVGRPFVDAEYVKRVSDLAAQLNEEALHHGPRKSVEIIPWLRQEDLATHYRWADVVCLPAIPHSWSPFKGRVLRRILTMPILEQFGRVLIEGMACGCVPVGSNIGGIPGAIGNAGFLTRPDNAAELADIFQTLASEPKVLRTASQKAVQHAAAFTWDALAARLVANLSG